ncbi:MAG: IS21 family transposase [Candidatus Binatia bacterium]
MTTERLPMRKTREILRQKWVLKLTHREVTASLGVSLGAVSLAVHRALTAGLDWPAVEALSETELEGRLYARRAVAQQPTPPDCDYLHRERHKPGVTLQLLHVEYLEGHPDGYRYTQFCEYYRRWVTQRGFTMRQVHRVGEKMFSDYAGKKPHWVDPHTGEAIEAELFVAVLGVSNYTYAEATATQQVPDWIGSHTRAVEYWGGVTAIVVPDQLKSGVTRACRYEPEVQRTYGEWAQHYDCVIIPARPKKPRDKAKVEVAVLVVERWILARLRHQSFFSLIELNARIAELLEDLNARRMRRYGASRRELFERLDRPALKPLPATRFMYAEWKKVKPNIDYHVEVEHHYYSVPFQLRHAVLEARVSGATVEIYCKGERVAAHVRSLERGRHTTQPAHMPTAHQQHQEWSPSRLIQWGQSMGPRTAELVAAILADRPHPEQGYRSCLGILRLGRHYGRERLEAACARALAARARSYRHVETILKHGLDRLPPKTGTPPAAAPPPPPAAAHLRGAAYYSD